MGPPPAWIAYAGVVGLALAIGVVAGASPAIAVGLAGAAVFALVAFANLAAGVCIFAVLIFVDVARVGGSEDLSMSKAAAIVLTVSWLARKTVRSEDDRDLLAAHPLLVLLLAALACWAGASAIWAESGPAAARATLRLVPNLMLFPIVYAAIRERSHLHRLFGAFVVGALASALYGTFATTGGASVSQAAEGRLTGATADANELAALLVVAIVLALAVGVTRRRHSTSGVLAVCAVPVALVALLATLSRAGVVALVVTLLASTVVAGRRRRRVVTMAVVGTLVVAVTYFSVASPTAWDRVTSSSSSGRDDIWKVAWRAAQDNPVLGVGADNYRVVAPRYLVQPGVIEVDQYILDDPQVAHNIYLEVLTDMGIVGLVLFLGVVAVSVGCAVRAATRFRLKGDSEMEIMAKALGVGLVGLLTAFFFTSEQYSKQLWLLLSLGPAVLAMSRRSSQ